MSSKRVLYDMHLDVNFITYKNVIIYAHKKILLKYESENNFV